MATEGDAGDAKCELPVSNSAINSTYHSFLVRLWQQTPEAPWRASAQSVQSGQATHFADMNALFQFLGAQVRLALRDQQTERMETKSEIQTGAQTDEQPNT